MYYIYVYANKKRRLTLPFVTAPIGIGVNWLRHVNGYCGHTNNKTEQETETETELEIETKTNLEIETKIGTGSEIV